MPPRWRTSANRASTALGSERSNVSGTRRAPCSCALARGLGHAGFVDVGEQERTRAFGRECDGDGPADAGCGAGDEGNFSGNVHDVNLCGREMHVAGSCGGPVGSCGGSARCHPNCGRRRDSLGHERRGG